MKLLQSSLIRKLAEIILGYSLERDPAFQKLLQALEACQDKNCVRATAYLHQIEQAVRTKASGYKELKDLYNIYKEALQALKDSKTEIAIDKMNAMVDIMRKSEKAIDPFKVPSH